MKNIYVLALGVCALAGIARADAGGVIGTAVSKWVASGGIAGDAIIAGPIIPTPDEIWQWRELNAVRANPAGAGWPQYPPAGPLAMNYPMTDAARFHSQEMITNKYFDHDSKDASGTSYENCFTRIKRFGYTADTPGGWLGENIAGCSSVPVAMDLWLNSTGHRENIMKKEFTEIGVGIKFGGPYGKMFTNDFGYRSISFDLAITDPDSDLTWQQHGDSVILMAWITNIGKTHAFPVYVAFYDGDPKAGGTLIAEPDSVPVLLRNQEKALARALWLDHIGSQHQVYVVVDPGNKFSETNESNNTGSMAVTIGVDETGWGGKAIAPFVECRPNPVRSRTDIAYGVPGAGRVTVAVYDGTGRLVKTLVNAEQASGRYRLVWPGDNEFGGRVEAGVYFIRCATAASTTTAKLVMADR